MSDKTTLQFTKDRPMLLLTILVGLLASLNVLLTFIRLRSHDFKVPVQYIAYDGSVIQTANWYSLYSLALFAILSAVAAIFLAHRLHSSNRMFAGGLLIAQTLLAVVTLLVTNSLLSLVAGV